jgi:hypothetical protein
MSITEPNQRRLSVVYQDVDDLKARRTNPRTHSKKQIAQIANAMRRYGFTNPVLVDEPTASLPATAASKLPKWWVLIRCRRYACLT